LSRLTDIRPMIYMITDGTLTDQNFLTRSLDTIENVTIAIRSGVSLVQLREKQLSAKNLCTLAEKIVKIAGATTKVMINDRADIAAAIGADGVQLTEGSLPVAVIRTSFPDLIVGASTHSADACAAAAKAGSDFAVFGPVYATPGKRPQGPEALADACEAAGEMPVIAIGGIDHSNYREVLASGASGFAAIRFLNNPINLLEIKKMVESA